jgi:hypothetical protein
MPLLSARGLRKTTTLRLLPGLTGPGGGLPG